MKPAFAMLVLALSAGTVRAQEFTFDDAEFKKKAFEFGGYAEAKLETLRLRPDTASYRLAYPEDPGKRTLERFTGTLELTGKWNAGSWVSDFRVQASHATDALSSSTDKGTLMEGGIRWSPTDQLWLDLGKRSQRWGKGYAWNPVGFIERPKDASDTQASREGYYMASSEWVKSLGGPLATVSVTAALLPSTSEINADFGQTGHVNPALKLYGLFYNTDIDLYWLGEGSRPEKLGVDFSRNLGPSFEFHGEWALTRNAPRNVVNAEGRVAKTAENVQSALLGLRYITANDITWIAEYYRNGAGYTQEQLRDYYDVANAALAPGASPQLFDRFASLTQSGYGKANPGRDYFYLRASANEPFEWLYTTTSLSTIVNLDDHSYQVTPEISYTGFKNIELRARLLLLVGDRKTEFGEKMTEHRVETYARFYF